MKERDCSWVRPHTWQEFLNKNNILQSIAPYNHTFWVNTSSTKERGWEVLSNLWPLRYLWRENCQNIPYDDGPLLTWDHIFFRKKSAYRSSLWVAQTWCLRKNEQHWKLFKISNQATLKVTLRNVLSDQWHWIKEIVTGKQYNKLLILMYVFYETFLSGLLRSLLHAIRNDFFTCSA